MTETEIESEQSTPVEDAPEKHPWAELGPEQFYLLRLNPLPTDRITGTRPLRFVQLGKAERHGEDLSVLSLSIQLPGQRVHRDQNLLNVWADHEKKEIRFTAEPGVLEGGLLQIEPSNRGLGRFLLAQGISWAKGKWGHYKVGSLDLPARDGFVEEMRKRRDHVLETQGFTLTYIEGQTLKAICSAPKASELNSEWNLDKVQVLSLLDVGSMLEQADKHLHEHELSIFKLQEQLAAYRRDDAGLKFTMACLMAFCLFESGLLIWMVFN
jgi:GNAT superfamily N-acetyltransferase